MKQFLNVVLVLLSLSSLMCEAKGGFSSGGGGRSSFSSSSSSRSFSSPSRSYSSPSRSTGTTTRTYSSTHITHSYNYGGMGMGYGYSNGILTGMIIGNMMHPQNTVVYNGGGYSGNALLYPDGRVVNQQGYQVGTYQNNTFSPIQNGQMVAQAVPNDVQQQQPQQVIVQQDHSAELFVVVIVLFSILALILLT